MNDEIRRGVAAKRGAVRSCAWALMLGAACVVGCARNPVVQVGLGPELAVADRESAPSVTVHLLGVGEEDLSALSAMSMSEYWDPGDPKGIRRRRIEKKGVMVVRLGSNGEKSYTLSPEDDIWNEWKAGGAKYLVVLSDTPSQAEDRPGDRDRRRRVIRIENGALKRQQIRVQVTPGGLVEVKEE